MAPPNRLEMIRKRLAASAHVASQHIEWLVDEVCRLQLERDVMTKQLRRCHVELQAAALDSLSLREQRDAALEELKKPATHDWDRY